ncbi:putative oligomerization/nucleic acid binding protein [Mucilaginibacter frigoritolerans]|uniref:Putative oligomerization/nucleic acid binding protein n=1 Tax=Mucilaginibacter frigoritolerans TaxID=652788 RepID=A0A562U8Z9_9SPHI|nr:PH domain-containing protein [Mucilaginibacter frigoritolerans]TWJ02234.1 putative oligomerization/nucleic acid binding protein [Mucilaginibacter frigoritolerans]
MIEKFLHDEQDPKAVEKVYQRLNDLLTTGEEIIYIAVQKKPLVNLFPDCVALTSKRVLFFTAANLGLTIKFVDFVWKDIVDVYTKEEIIGAIFSVRTTNDTEMGVDYLPKVQARKLYQYAQERKEAEREGRRLRDLEEKRAESGAIQFEKTAAVVAQPPVTPEPVHTPVAQEVQKPDELTEKLKKLKMLFDNGLISQEDYNHKKMEFLSEL